MSQPDARISRCFWAGSAGELQDTVPVAGECTRVALSVRVMFGADPASGLGVRDTHLPGAGARATRLSCTRRPGRWMCAPPTLALSMVLPGPLCATTALVLLTGAQAWGDSNMGRGAEQHNVEGLCLARARPGFDSCRFIWPPGVSSELRARVSWRKQANKPTKTSVYGFCANEKNNKTSPFETFARSRAGESVQQWVGPCFVA